MEGRGAEEEVQYVFIGLLAPQNMCGRKDHMMQK
jgi:hypothetical protein